MLRGNLATKPFYNERLATLAIIAAIALVTVLTAFNATRLFSLSAQRRALVTRIERDQTEAARIRTEASATDARADTATLDALARATAEANALIDQRTFSWTGFFTLIEKTLPADVRVVSVTPRVEQGTFRVAMTVVSRNLSNVASFSDALRSTGAFLDVAAIEQQRRTDGLYNATIEASYTSLGSASLAATTPPEAP